eukprot:g26163.t1
MDRLCQVKEAGMRGRVGHGMRPGNGVMFKLVNSMFRLAQVLYKAVSEPPLGLTDVEEATSGAVDQVDRCASEPLSDVQGLFCALNGGEGGGVGA